MVSDYRFGSFTLRPGERLLLDGEQPLRLGSRAIELLAALLERPGEVVPSRELIARVWPDSPVGDSSLRVHMASLRKLLGDGQGGSRFIATVPMRGYCFVARVERLVPEAARSGPAPAAASRIGEPSPQDSGLPMALGRLIGRDVLVASLMARLPERRHLTLVGPGGVGKTSLAVAVARRALASYAQGARFVELGSLGDGTLVASAVATALGLSVDAQDPTPQVCSALRERSLLLVLDNCEHVIDAAAELSAAVLSQAAGVHILATSREPLRTPLEWVHRVAPLGLPAEGAALASSRIEEFPALALFAERAAASVDSFRLDDADLPTIARICKRLDGIPLAIELAAPRLESCSLKDLEALLDQHLTLATRGRRTALPRHQTLQGLLDWSHALLSPLERLVLRRLSLFRGSFTLPSAVALCRSDDVASPADDSDVISALLDLATKSLLVVDLADDVVRYRLLDMTRRYALAKLHLAGETLESKRRHASGCLAHFTTPAGAVHAGYAAGATGAAGAAMANADTAAIRAQAGAIDDVRSALDWAFSREGDAALGCQLTAASAPLWFQLLLMSEYRSRAELALARLAEAPEPAPEVELGLCAALGHVLAHLEGPGSPAQVAACTRALALARQTGAGHQQLQMLYRLWHGEIARGQHRVAMGLALEFDTACEAVGDSSDRLQRDRMMAVSCLAVGRQNDARRHVEQMLTHPAVRANNLRQRSFVLDERVMALTFRTEILWLQGHADEAREASIDCVREAEAKGHTLSLLYALALGACPVSLWLGDLALARANVKLLRSLAAEQKLGLWDAWAYCHDHALSLRTGEPMLSPLPPGEAPPSLNVAQQQTLATLADGFATETLVAHCLADDMQWCAAEVLRSHAVAMLARDGDAATAAARPLLERAVQVASRQAALGWELRSATSLAELLQREGRAAEARAVLAPVMQRFSQGFTSRDWLRAVQVLG